MRMSRFSSPVPMLSAALLGSSTASAPSTVPAFSSTGNTFTRAPPLDTVWMPT